jgi:hypothetical protein
VNKKLEFSNFLQNNLLYFYKRNGKGKTFSKENFHLFQRNFKKSRKVNNMKNKTINFSRLPKDRKKSCFEVVRGSY